MKHFENNVNDGMSRTDSIETLSTSPAASP